MCVCVCVCVYSYYAICHPYRDFVPSRNEVIACLVRLGSCGGRVDEEGGRGVTRRDGKGGAHATFMIVLWLPRF